MGVVARIVVMAALSGCTTNSPTVVAPVTPHKPVQPSPADWLQACATRMARHERTTLVALRSEAKLTTRVHDQVFRIRSPGPLVFRPARRDPHQALAGVAWVFAGHGLDLPALGWDDFAGIDLKGKAVLLLDGFPPITTWTSVSSRKALEFPVGLDDGDWHQRVDNVRRRGAALALIVSPGANPAVWQARRQFPEILVESSLASGSESWMGYGWLSEVEAERWLQACGHSLETLRSGIREGDFKPEPLPITSDLSLEVESESRSLSLDGRASPEPALNLVNPHP